MVRKSLVSLAAAAAISAIPALAVAAPVGPVAAINITVSPDLAAKTRDFSASDLKVLQDELRRSVESQLKRKGVLSDAGGTLDLVIEDAKATRPTIRQMSSKPGLSFESFGLGGVELTGTYRGADGVAVPLKYDWYETDIRQASYGWTWQGASDGFQRFAMKLTRG